MFEVKVYKGRTLAEGAQIAISGRLWVPGWCLLPTLYSFVKGKTIDRKVAIGFLDDVPVAVTIVDGTTVMAFCRKAVRRNGYASRCLSAIKDNDIYAQEGIKGSLKFWHRNDVQYVAYSRY